jgi:hypothetical protein
MRGRREKHRRYVKLVNGVEDAVSSSRSDALSFAVSFTARQAKKQIPVASATAESIVADATTAHNSTLPWVETHG